MFSKALVILASISAALAVPYITLPVASTTYEAGKNATVKWQDDGKEPSLAKYGPCKISIYAGNALQQTSLQSITNNIDISKESELSFVPDATIGPNSSEYFIRIESIDLKDAAQPQYPAMAFSSKFTLSGMTGTFSRAVLDQISGQSTAPLASPTGSTRSGSSSVPTASGFSTTATKKPSSSPVPSPTQSRSAAESIVFHGSWIGFLLSTFFGAAML
jgi:hypothetical protein